MPNTISAQGVPALAATMTSFIDSVSGLEGRGSSRWRRAWKLELIERHNPQWHDLYDQLA